MEDPKNQQQKNNENKEVPEEKIKKELEDLKSKIEESEKLKNNYLDSWKRERADFLNYKKDESKRLDNILAYQREMIILNLLPILDNFGIAIKNIPENLIKNENVKGLLQIEFQLKNFLKNLGVEEIKAIGEKFDPLFHEIIEQIESKDKPPGTIIEEIEKGYKIGDKILRPSKIKIVK